MGDAVRLTAVERAFAIGVPPRVSEVLRCVARESGVSVPDILGASRERQIYRARALAMHVCARDLGAGVRDIGRWFGRDCSTVTHALRFVAAELATFEGADEPVDCVLPGYLVWVA